MVRLNVLSGTFKQERLFPGEKQTGRFVRDFSKYKCLLSRGKNTVVRGFEL